MTRIDDPAAAPAPAAFREAYRQRLDEGWLEDEAQETAVAQLAGLLSSLQSVSSRPKGLYLHGPVGRGKSQLLNLFVEHLGAVPSRRIHMHAFMGELHERLNQSRDGDPVQQIARAIRAQCRVLGFDEFYVTNIADAMLLGRLFEFLFKNGVIVVATSNWPIENLFQNGRNRKAFLPFIRLLKQHLTAINLADGVDYRLPEDPQWPLYVLTTPGVDATSRLEALFERYAGEGDSTPPGGIVAWAFQGRAGWYHFADICRQALGRAEYLELVERADTIVLEHLPFFTKDDSDAALRLVTLIDICYEHHRRVIVSAPAYPDALYAMDGPVAEAFRRVASRLTEMQTWA